MKKNKTMRAASALLVAVLLTTSVVSGTFAKYTTSDDASDSARVAKFGVVVTADGTLFSETYINAPEIDAEKATVVSSDYATADDNVVAPGTNNADNAFTFSITGQPEVDVRIDVVVDDADKDVFLKAGTLPDMTADDPDTFTLEKDYYPVKYTLKKDNAPITAKIDGNDKVIKDVTLVELEKALESLTKEVQANENLATEFGTYEITWTWDYGTPNTYNDNQLSSVDVSKSDQADTLLGALAAGNVQYPDGYKTASAKSELELGMDKDYNLTTGLKITITVTQIN